MVYILTLLLLFVLFVYEYRIMEKAYGNISSSNLTLIWAKLRYLIGSHMWTIDQNKYAKGNGDNDIVAFEGTKSFWIILWISVLKIESVILD